MTASAIYEGEVRHERFDPKTHRFGQRMFLLYLDLDELPQVFERRWLWSVGRPNLASFRRKDYLGPVDRPLKEAALDRVESELGFRPTGPVRMLTHVRTLGYVFNPVTFYYCFDEDGGLAALVAEITNTPWKERHAYVLDAGGAAPGEIVRWSFDKDFHVSPFFDLDQVYEWAFRVPGERLDVHMTNRERGRAVFTAQLGLERRALSGGSLARALLRYPLLTWRVHFAIYLQAAILWLKQTPFYTHPTKRVSTLRTR